MVRSRLEQDIAALETRFAVRYAADDRTVILENVALPDGFTPPTVPIQIRLPDAWPYASPRVELPWTIRVDGVIPRRLLNDGRWLVRTHHLGDPYIYWPKWDPQISTLETMTETMLQDLEHCGTSARTMDDSDHDTNDKHDTNQS